MKNKLYLFLILTICTGIFIPTFSHAYDYIYEDFDDYITGQRLGGQGNWYYTTSTNYNFVTSTLWYFGGKSYAVKGDTMEVTSYDTATSTSGGITFWYYPKTTTSTSGYYTQFIIGPYSAAGINLGITKSNSSAHYNAILYEGTTEFCTSTDYDIWHKLEIEWSNLSTDIHCENGDWYSLETSTFQGGGLHFTGGSGDIGYAYVDEIRFMGDESSRDPCTIWKSTTTCAAASCIWDYFTYTINGETTQAGCRTPELGIDCGYNEDVVYCNSSSTCSSHGGVWETDVEHCRISGSSEDLIYGSGNEVRRILGNKVPFYYFFQMWDAVKYLAFSDNNATMTDVNVIVPTVMGTGTHATTVIMTGFTIPIVSQTWIYRLLPESVWATLRSIFGSFLIVITFFAIKPKFKQIFAVDL